MCLLLTPIEFQHGLDGRLLGHLVVEGVLLVTVGIRWDSWTQVLLVAHDAGGLWSTEGGS